MKLTSVSIAKWIITVIGTNGTGHSTPQTSKTQMQQQCKAWAMNMNLILMVLKIKSDISWRHFRFAQSGLMTLADLWAFFYSCLKIDSALLVCSWCFPSSLDSLSESRQCSPEITVANMPLMHRCSGVHHVLSPAGDIIASLCSSHAPLLPCQFSCTPHLM